ncbi:MAG: DUF6502 family protein [Rubrivivax sp.]|nr:DUF6502 family protein [Rubrivivax sp.]
MTTRSQIVLAATLGLVRPLVRLLIRQGVAYPAFASALKAVFLQAARDELASRDMPVTDSAVSLLSGVHRRDVRRLGRSPTPLASDSEAPLSLAAEVVGRWMSDPHHLAPDGSPRPLPRTGEGSFDALVQQVSQDVRPRAMLDEMLRLGVVREEAGAVALEGDGLAPRQGFQELAALFAANLQDHLAAAAANLQGDANFLEQAVHVDEISESSARSLQQVSVAAWRDAMRAVMTHARDRFEHDAEQVRPAQRRHRARFGVYFFSERENSQ